MSGPQGGLGPLTGASSRAKKMLSAATSGGSGKKRPVGALKPPLAAITFARKAKREAGEYEDQSNASDILSSMTSTPKKQRTAETPQGRLPSGYGAGRFDALPLGRLKSVTCTQLTDSFSDRAAKQQEREHRLEQEDERQQRLQAPPSSGGSGWVVRSRAATRLPAGMRNLGNTCYLNAVLQVLLSLPSFLADLKQGCQQLQAANQPLSPTGVYSALLECVAAKDSLSGGRTYITPASLKRALDAASAAFRGAFQQDAHELLCSLLDVLQSEVLTREVARYGRIRIRISETVDPAALNFGFAVQHEMTCRSCGHASRVLEEYMHLSLELPEPQPGSAAPACSIAQLLNEYFKEEEVEKSCEGCGGTNLPHSLRHTIRRLPRVLVLHLKRFKVSWNGEGQQAVCQKLHTRIEMPEALRLAAYLAVGALPPLAGGQARDLGKENESQQANAAPDSQQGAGAYAAAATAAAAAAHRPGSQLKERSGMSFYCGGGGGGHTPVGVHAQLLATSPYHGRASKPGFLHTRRRQGTPKAGNLLKGASSLEDEEEDEELQKVLAASLLEHQQHQQQQHLQQRQQPPQQQQQGQDQPVPSPHPLQQQEQEGRVALGLGLRRRGAEEEEALDAALAPDCSPHAGPEAAEGMLPREGEAAAVAGSTAGTNHRLQSQWFMGLGTAGDQQVGSGAGIVCNDGVAGAGKTAAEREEEELQQAIQLSMLDEQQRQPALAPAPAPAVAGPVGLTGGSPALTEAAGVDADEAGMVTPVLGGLDVLGRAAAGEVAAEEDADLQRALQLSLLDQGGASCLPATAAGETPSALGGDAEVTPAVTLGNAEQKQEQLQHHQRPQPAFLSIFQEVMREPTEGAEAGGSAGTAAPYSEADASQKSQQQQLGAAINPAGGLAVLGSASATEPPGSKQAAARTAGTATAAAAYVHAGIVEDDAPLAEGEEQAPQHGHTATGAAILSEAAGAARCTSTTQPSPPGLYRLHAVVNHEGPAASCGHFTADICDPATHTWHRHNDSLTTRISTAEARNSARQRQCYLLFYVAASGGGGGGAGGG